MRASISYGLGANVENLELTGASNIDGSGNALANSLSGNTGSNVLDGGAGADNMAGGAGNDTYWVDDAGDTVIENDNEGDDTVRASVDFTLSANVENLTPDREREASTARATARPTSLSAMPAATSSTAAQAPTT